MTPNKASDPNNEQRYQPLVAKAMIHIGKGDPVDSVQVRVSAITPVKNLFNAKMTFVLLSDY